MPSSKTISSAAGVAVFLIALIFYRQGSFGYGPLYELIAIIPKWTARMVVDGGPLLVFVLMTLESSSLPIPSEVILPLSGFLVASGKMSLVAVLVAANAGSLLGSLVDYYIGMLIGIEGLEKRNLLSQANIRRATGWFRKYGALAVFITRMLPGMRTLISFPAGAFRMSLTSFLFCTFLGSFLWSLVLVYIGIALGQNWESAIQLLNRFLVPAALGAAVAFIIYAAMSLRASRPA